MEELIFSLNATVPLFLVVICGYLLYLRGLLTEEFVAVANKFYFQIALPALVIRDLSSADFREVWDIKFVFFCVLTTTISFFIIWGLAKIFIREAGVRGAFVQASYRSSAAILGFALIQNIYGESVMTPLMIIGCVPLFNIFAVLVLTFEGDGTGNKSIKDACREIIRNPIIIGIIIGVILSLQNINFPKMLKSTVNSFAVLASPLALLALGAGFRGREAIAKLRPTIAASLIKLVILPVIFLPVAVWLGFREDGLIAILIMLGSPTTVSSYVMAKNMGGDEILTSSVVVVTTMLSAFSITAILFALRSLALV